MIVQPACFTTKRPGKLHDAEGFAGRLLRAQKKGRDAALFLLA